MDVVLRENKFSSREVLVSEAVWDLDELLEDLRKRATEADLPAVPELLAAIEEFRLGLDWDWDWETILAKVAAAREAVDQFERTVVRSARLQGETWDNIADGLNSNRHTVRYRYGRNDLEELDRLDQAHDAESQVALSRLRALQARGVTDRVNSNKRSAPTSNCRPDTCGSARRWNANSALPSRRRADMALSTGRSPRDSPTGAIGPGRWGARRNTAKGDDRVTVR